MNENLAKFTTALSANPALAAKLEAVQAKDPQDVAEQIVAISEEAGTPVSMEEVLMMGGALSEWQLEAVSGGVGPWDPDIIDIYKKEGGEWWERLIKQKIGESIPGPGSLPPVPGTNRWT